MTQFCFSIFRSEIVKFIKFGNSSLCVVPHVQLMKHKQTSAGAVVFSDILYVYTSECSMSFSKIMFLLIVSDVRHVSVCGIFSSPLPKNYTAHLTCSSPSQSHPKPCQLHGAHHCIGPERSHNPERNCRRDHLLLHRQHPGTDGRDGMSHTNCLFQSDNSCGLKCLLHKKDNSPSRTHQTPFKSI